jgi:hypothetical protein
MNPPARDHPRPATAIRASRDDRGQATGFVIGIFLALWLFAGIVVDGGLTLAGKTQAMDIAQEAARTGAQQLDLARLRHQNDIHLLNKQAAQAARDYVATTGDSGMVSVTDDAVTVQVTHHQRMQILQLVGVRTLTVHASATAHAERATPPSALSPGTGGQR